ncbi:fasciclin domain-containing protein [uncultured Pontibacter sp.]|uniref:fasciclin domain-containing protein n=1 Tax=uncultured Pontibacter sp. TaxID=453356 RepID=UPI00262A7887|nr:fasciclin domain-containing protein [uncultured Pontibacter sp.]
MKKGSLYLIACALMCSTMLAGCGGADDSRNENPMQEERSRPNLGSETEARGTNQNTDGHQSGEGDSKGGREVDASGTISEIGGREMSPSQNIVENINSVPDITTFASAMRKAELVKTLNGTGPYTVLAPNNGSFEALPDGRLSDLMKNENKQQLVELLNNHVIAGKLSAESLQDGAILKTIGGQQLRVSKRGADTMINGAKIETADNMSSNGVVHVINKVMVPEAK